MKILQVIPPIGVTTASGGDGRKGKIAPAIDAVSGGATIDGSIDTDAKKGKSDGKTRGENNGDNNGDDDNSVSGFDTLKVISGFFFEDSVMGLSPKE